MHIYIWTSIRAIILWSLKALGQRVHALLSRNVFHSLGHCDLDLWPTDPKINKGFLLNKSYHPMKFEGSGSKGTQVIERQRFSLFGSLWPWPLTYWPQNQYGSFTQKGLPPYEVWRLWPKGYSSFWAEMVFTLRVTVTLTFDLLTPKSIGVFYSIRATTPWSLKARAQRVLKLLSKNGFYFLGHCDLDLWHTDPKINRGILLNKDYHPMKFEGSGSKGTWVIERKRFSLFGSLWPWPLTYWPQYQ